MKINFRPITIGDMGFLFKVYASTRDEEMAIVPWTDPEKESFLRHQFNAQHSHYQKFFPGASYSIIVVEGEEAGRLYVNRAPDEVRVIDVSLLPENRGRGIGGKILRDLLGEASADHKPVRVHVLKHNSAMKLYQRLGFREIEDRDPYLFMEKAPG